MALTLMKGSEAIAEAAIRAGARFFFGYPITPQTEIPEYMSARMPEIGGCFLQAESEVAAINMVYGAAGTGARVITSSSSPGVSLKQEGISYCAGAMVPAVIINVMRGGPGLGNIQASQGDYFQGVKGGGNGDYHLLTFAPASVQEAIDLMMIAYDKAEKYRIPVLFLADGIIAQMMEPVELPEMVDYKVDPEKKPWACTGWKPGDDPAKRGVINSIYIDTESLAVHNDELQAMYKEVVANEQMWESYNCENADYIITAFGTVARVAKSAIARAEGAGHQRGSGSSHHRVAVPLRCRARGLHPVQRQGCSGRGAERRPDAGGREAGDQRRQAGGLLRSLRQPDALYRRDRCQDPEHEGG